MISEVVTYVPDNCLKKGYLALLKEIVQEIVRNRWLTLQLFKRDFFASYKQSIVGIVWIFVMPLFNVGAFVLLNQSGVFNVGEVPVPYPLYAILSMSLWQIFAGGLMACSSSLTNAGDMLTRINFSRKSLVFAAIGRPIVSLLIQFGLVFVLCFYYRITPHLNAIYLPFVFVAILCLTVSLGMILAILNSLVKDTGNLLYILLMLLMYLTPVLYAKPLKGLLAVMTQYNPMYYLLSAGRDLFLWGEIKELNAFVWVVLGSILLFLFSLVFFHLSESRLAERI